MEDIPTISISSSSSSPNNNSNVRNRSSGRHHNGRGKRRSKTSSSRRSRQDRWPHLTTLILSSMLLFILANLSSTGIDRIREASANIVPGSVRGASQTNRQIQHMEERYTVGQQPWSQTEPQATAKYSVSYLTPSTSETTSELAMKNSRVKNASAGAAGTSQARVTSPASTTSSSAKTALSFEKTSSSSTKTTATEQNATSSEKDMETAKLKMELHGFQDNWDRTKKSDNPIFWYIPKSGGSIVKDYLGSCYSMVLASEVGVQNGHEEDKELKVIKKGNNQFVNVDTTTRKGIQRAKQIGYTKNHLADVIITPLFRDIEKLFSSDSPGRVFALFREPIDRAVTMFNYLQNAEWEPTYNSELRNMTLSDYAKSDYIEDNYLTRILVNKTKEPLDRDDAEVAVDIIRRKVLVGLMTDMESSLDRFEKFFEWRFHDHEVQESCRKFQLNVKNNANKKETEVPEPGSKDFASLASKNVHDMHIYKYVKQLFKEQEEFVKGKPDNFRMAVA